MSSGVKNVVPPRINSTSGLPLSDNASWTSRTFSTDREKMVNFSAFNYSRAIFLQEKHEAVNMQVIYDTKCSIKKRV